MKYTFNNAREKKNDYAIIMLTALLVAFGMLMLGSASSNMSQTAIGDSWYFLRHQAIHGLGLGLIGFIAASLIYYKRYERWALWGMGFAIILLTLTFTPLALETKGAARWVDLGFVTFQPAEPLKLFFIIYLAALFSSNRAKKKNARAGFIAFLAIIGVIAGILLKQPATSTAILLTLVALAMYFMSGARIMHIVITVCLAAALLAPLIYFTPYRMARISAFLAPAKHSQTANYQVSQAQRAIKMGGALGVGYGQSTTKIKYLPEPLADSIFAVIGEELGFAGSLALIALFLALILRLLFVAHTIHDQFGSLILIGFASVIGLQVLVNIGAISGLLPLTGMPLPFISYGGTALATALTMMGIANNISKYS